MNYKQIKIHVGQNLRDMRIQRGFTQAELARRAQLSVTFLGRLERGACSMSVRTLLNLCEALNCLPSRLLQTPPSAKKKAPPPASAAGPKPGDGAIFISADVYLATSRLNWAMAAFTPEMMALGVRVAPVTTMSTPPSTTTPPTMPSLLEDRV